MAAAPGLLFWLLVVGAPWRVPGQQDPGAGRRFSEHKLCADDECSMLMYRGEALEDFTGPDCRFVNFKKGDSVYVYYKLAGRWPEVWAGSVGRIFGYFPKDLIQVVHEYTKEELQIPTDETDFVCFDGGRDDFDNYNVADLLGFLELYDSATGNSEKAVEKTSQHVDQLPEVSKESEPEPVEVSSEENESVFSENTKDLKEQFMTQKNHPHTNSQADDAQGEHSSFEPFKEVLQEKLQVPENENNKTNNSSQVSKEQEKMDAYKLLKKEMTLDLKTKFGSTADALVSDDETTSLVTSLEDDFDEELEAEYYEVKKEEEENLEDFDELPLLTFKSGEDTETAVKSGVEKYSTDKEQNTNKEDKVEGAVPSGIKKEDMDILTSWGDTIFSIVTGGEEKTGVMDLESSDSEEEKDDDVSLVPGTEQGKPQSATEYTDPEHVEDSLLIVEVPKTSNDKGSEVGTELDIKGKGRQESERGLVQDEIELEDEKPEGVTVHSSTQSNNLNSLPAAEKGKDILQSASDDKDNDLEGAAVHISKGMLPEKKPGEIFEGGSGSDSVHKAVGSQMNAKKIEQESLGLVPLVGDDQHNVSRNSVEEADVVLNGPKPHTLSVEHQREEFKEDVVLKTHNQPRFSSPGEIRLPRELEEEVPIPGRNLSWSPERDMAVAVPKPLSEMKRLSEEEVGDDSTMEESVHHKAVRGTQEPGEAGQAAGVGGPGFYAEKPEAEEEDYLPEELLEDENAQSAKQAKDRNPGVQDRQLEVNLQVPETAFLGTTDADPEIDENKQEANMLGRENKNETAGEGIDTVGGEPAGMAVEKDDHPLVDEKAQMPSDTSDFPDQVKTWTPELGEVFQKNDPDYLKRETPEERLKTPELAEKPGGEEPSKEDHEDIEKFLDTESQGSASEELDDDPFHWAPHTTVEPKHRDKREDLPIINTFFKEQQSLQRFQKYFDVHELEAMLQEMSLKLKSAQRESLPYNVEKVLDKVFRASESQILSIAEQMLDARVTKSREQGMKESNVFEEAAVLDDVQDLIYFVRYRHSTEEETAPLVVAPPLQEGWGKPGEEMKPPHEDNFSQENVDELHMQVPEEHASLDQLLTGDVGAAEVSQTLNTEKDLDPGVITTEGTPANAVDAKKQLEIDAEETAVVTPLENAVFLVYSFLFYLTKSPGSVPKRKRRQTVVSSAIPQGSVASPLSWPYTMDSVPATVPSITAASGDPELLGPLSVLYAAFIAKLLELVATLTDDVQPGPDFYGLPWKPVLITAFLGIASFAVFFCRTVLVVKNRVYQVTEQQISEKLKAIMKENADLVQKLSNYEQKIKESKKHVQETKKQNMILSDEAIKFKDKIKKLEETNESLDDTAKSLRIMLESEREQNVRNQDLILENKKSIEKLKDVISMNASEFSEVQIALNEAKLSEEKVKSECHRVQEENARLKKKKEQLQQEIEDWSKSHAELSEQIKSFEESQKDLQVALTHKDDNIDALTNCITQLNRLECESESEGQNKGENESDELANGEVGGNRKEKMKNQIKQMMDVSRTQTAISVVEEDLKLLQFKLRASMSTKCNLEDQIKNLEDDRSSLQAAKARLEDECVTLRQKVEILNELYQQKEMALQKKLSQEEYERQEREQKLSAADEKAVLAAEEVKTYKRRIEEMEDELQKTERSFKNQIATHEKKAHDNWLKARAAERAIAEEKREAANLRHKILELTQKIAMLQEEPVIVKPMPGRPNTQNPPRRGALSQNGSFGPSPVSGGECSPPLTVEPPVRPLSATLNRRDIPRSEFGSVEGPLPRPRWPSEASGKPSASDPGSGTAAMMNSSSRNSSPTKVMDESKEPEGPSVPGSTSLAEHPVAVAVNMTTKGPPPFPGVPLMSPPIGGGPLPPPIRYGPPPQLCGPFGPRPLPPPFGPGMRPPLGLREYAPGVPPGKRDLPLDPREFLPGHAPFRPLGSLGPREYFIPSTRLPPPAHGPQDYPPSPAARDLPPSGSSEPPSASQSSNQDCSQALKQSP
ncbi:transport and Golgi organization protein 1 homolog isoform X2 [Otolemur garnettii]|uniref:transport and Golgi organization protein 1 homolog isoform X2 n=1 Tax=Otolemur garnettii TaxID=30611 RepID=UPI000C7EF28A|nr:transport and Golgi organization protein 1 homolog isoform X2 [Otolemur garnettii]